MAAQRGQPPTVHAGQRAPQRSGWQWCRRRALDARAARRVRQARRSGSVDLRRRRWSPYLRPGLAQEGQTQVPNRDPASARSGPTIARRPPPVPPSLSWVTGTMEVGGRVSSLRVVLDWLMEHALLYLYEV